MGSHSRRRRSLRQFHDWGRPFCHVRGVTDNTKKRRLPVVQSAGAESEEEPRPPWHWVGFGAVAIFIVWLPLAYAAEALGRRLLAPRLAGRNIEDLAHSERLRLLTMLAVTQLAALVIASLAGGFLVTRFGRGTRRRDAAFAGLAVGLLALGLTCSQGASAAALIVPLVAGAAAGAGGALGRKVW